MTTEVLDVVTRGEAIQHCVELAVANKERIDHFFTRAKELGREDVAVLVINVDDENGRPLADHLLPGTDWDAIRAQGEVPVARGLTTRDGLAEDIGQFDPLAGMLLNGFTGVPLIIVDAGIALVVDVFRADEPAQARPVEPRQQQPTYAELVAKIGELEATIVRKQAAIDKAWEESNDPDDPGGYVRTALRNETSI